MVVDLQADNAKARKRVKIAEIQLTNSLRALYPEGSKTSLIVKNRLAEEISGKSAAQRLRLSRFEVSFDSFELFEVLGQGGFATARVPPPTLDAALL